MYYFLFCCPKIYIFLNQLIKFPSCVCLKDLVSLLVLGVLNSFIRRQPVEGASLLVITRVHHRITNVCKLVSVTFFYWMHNHRFIHRFHLHRKALLLLHCSPPFEEPDIVILLNGSNWWKTCFLIIIIKGGFRKLCLII